MDRVTAPDHDSDSAAELARLFPALAREPGLPQRLVRESSLRRMAAGAVLFDRHTPCSGFPLLLAGTVRVVQRYPNGRELQLYRIRPGESCLLSGSCLLSEAEYQATGIAETEVEVLVLPPAAFHRLLAEDATFRRHVFASFGVRLADVMQRVEALASQRVDQRLAAMLLERADASGTVHATHQALADAVGSVREIVSRLLRTFEERRWVRLGRERITILDRAGLSELART